MSYSRDTKGLHYNPLWNANNHQYIDLGLPSGTLWATKNVGAKEPSNSGLYFQWGDTSGYAASQVGTGSGQKKFARDWSDYKWNIDGDSNKFKKYTTAGATLDLEDDAAHVNMGGDWHMPTPAQIQELIDNTTTSVMANRLTKMSVLVFTSMSDKTMSIFIPMAGYAEDGSVSLRGSYGFAWSAILSASNTREGQCLNFDSSSAALSEDFRSNGFPVRGVLG